MISYAAEAIDRTDDHGKILTALGKISQRALLCENDPMGPRLEIGWLRESGALEIVLPGKPLDFNGNNMVALLRLLKNVGKANLSVGRIYEGHINTLYLIHLYGSEEQRDKYYREVKEQGYLFGIWNTQDSPGVNFIENNGRVQVMGIKTFCSGALLVNRALITGNISTAERDGWQMAVLDMTKIDRSKIDIESWKPLGMKASGSYTVDFSGYQLNENELLGAPGIYLNQPYFSGGAIRFAAVQLGGAECICEETIDYLSRLKRTDDAFQRVRIAKMVSLLVSGKLILEQAAEHYDEWVEEDDMSEHLIAFANMTRVIIEDSCLQIMEESNRCVGARGLMETLPLGLFFRDLSFYLRQPAPDATRVNVGAFYLNNPAAIHA